MAKNRKDPNNMSFLDHLEDLRWHLIRSTLSIVIAAVVAFIFADFIFDSILFAPKRGDFVTYKILCDISTWVGVDGGFCFSEDIPFRIQSRTMGGQFSAHVWTSITAGFIVAFPYILYEVWRFISPGMKNNERKSARGFVIVSSLLFFIGVLFGYYVITPLSINFLGTYTVSDEVFNDFDLSSYFGLIRSSVIASGLIFELPIIIYFLTKTSLVTPQFLRSSRKYALVLILVLAAVITPPDIVSQIVVAIPVLILYEISILISYFVHRSLLKKEKQQKHAQ